MSDVEPELPPELAEAIVGTGPSSADVGLIKAAFTWRTVDTELMDLAFDSHDDLAGVRDSGAARSFEFIADGRSVIVEITAGVVIVSLVPAIEGQATLHRLAGDDISLSLSALGRAEFADVAPGPARISIQLADTALDTPTFTIP